jgi:hypothetical protein
MGKGKSCVPHAANSSLLWKTWRIISKAVGTKSTTVVSVTRCFLRGELGQIMWERCTGALCLHVNVAGRTKIGKVWPNTRKMASVGWRCPWRESA